MPISEQVVFLPHKYDYHHHDDDYHYDIVHHHPELFNIVLTMIFMKSGRRGVGREGSRAYRDMFILHILCHILYVLYCVICIL